jgi:hypothetical protein
MVIWQTTRTMSHQEVLPKRTSVSSRTPLFRGGIDGFDNQFDGPDNDLFSNQNRYETTRYQEPGYPASGFPDSRDQKPPLSNMSDEQLQQTLDFFGFSDNFEARESETRDLLRQIRLSGQFTGLGEFRRCVFQLNGTVSLSGQSFLERLPTEEVTPREAYRLMPKKSLQYMEQEEVGLAQAALVMEMMKGLGLLEERYRDGDPLSIRYKLSSLAKKILKTRAWPNQGFSSEDPALDKKSDATRQVAFRPSSFTPYNALSNGLSDDAIMDMLREEPPLKKPVASQKPDRRPEPTRSGQKKGHKPKAQKDRGDSTRYSDTRPDGNEWGHRQTEDAFSPISEALDLDSHPLEPVEQDTRTPEERAFQEGVQAIHHLENELLGGIDQEAFSFGDMAKIRTEQLRALMNVYESPNNGWDILNTVHQLNKKSTWQKLPFTSKGQPLDKILKQGALGMSSTSIRKHLAELEKLRLIQNTGNPSVWLPTPGLSSGKLKDTDRFVVTEKGLQALQQDNPKVAGVLTTDQLQQLIRYEAQQIKQKQATDEQEWKALKLDLDQSQAYLAKRQSLVKNMESLLQAKLKREASFEETPECKTIQVRLETLSTHLKQEEASHQQLRERAEKALALFDEARVANQKKLQALMQASYNLKQKAFNQEVIDFTADLNRPASDLSRPASSEETFAVGPSGASPFESQDQAIKVLEAMIQSDLTHSEVRLDFTQA